GSSGFRARTVGNVPTAGSRFVLRLRAAERSPSTARSFWQLCRPFRACRCFSRAGTQGVALGFLVAPPSGRRLHAACASTGCTQGVALGFLVAPPSGRRLHAACASTGCPRGVALGFFVAPPSGRRLHAGCAPTG